MNIVIDGWFPKTFSALKVIMVAVVENKLIDYWWVTSNFRKYVVWWVDPDF